MWKELQGLRPTVVLTLGILPATLLLRKKVVLKGVAGKFHPLDYLPGTSLVPWYSPHTLLTRGKASDEATVNLFKEIKERL